MKVLHYFFILLIFLNCSSDKKSPTQPVVEQPIFNLLINNLESNGTVSGEITINFSSDTNTISKIEFYINDIKSFEILESPFLLSWDTTKFIDGTYTIKIIAFDINNKTTTKNFSVKIDNNFDGTFEKKITLPNASGKLMNYGALETDDGYILLGRGSIINYPTNNDIFLVDLDIKGDLQGFKVYNITGIDLPRDFIRTSDGGYIISGQTYQSSAQNADAFLLRTDFNKELLWSKTYDSSGLGGGGGGYDVALSIKSDGTGFVSGAGWGGKRYLSILRVDSSGNKIDWNYFGDGTDMGTAFRWSGDEDNYSPMIQKSTTGGYALTGYRSSSTESGGRTYLIHFIKTNNSGSEIIINKEFGEGNPGWMGKVLIETEDYGFIIAGFHGTTNTAMGDIVVLKIDSQGNQIWLNKYSSGNGSINSIDRTLDGGYILTGYTNLTSDGNLDIYLLKIDSSGNELWSKQFGGNFNDSGLKVQTTSDGGYLISGYYSNSNQESDFYLIKTDQNGNIN